MNKTTTRLAATGGVIVLGAFALVLAQSDARRRDRDPPQIERPASQSPVPIPVDDSRTSWGSTAELPSNPMLVQDSNEHALHSAASPERDQQAWEDDGPTNDLRAESAGGLPRFPAESQLDDHTVEHTVERTGAMPDELAYDLPSSFPGQLPQALPGQAAANDEYSDGGYESEPNPLRHAAGDPDDESRVVLAGAGMPVDGPAANASAGSGSATSGPPPAWLNSGGNGPSTTPNSNSASTVSQPQAGQSQGLPSFPVGSNLGAGSPSAAAPTAQALQPPSGGALPTLPTMLPTSSSNVSDMSDVQRGALPATNMLPGSGALAPPTAAPQRGAAPNFNQLPGGLASGSAIPSPVATAVSAGGPASTQTSSPERGESPLLRTAGLSGLVSNQPGNRYLDGSQNPSMMIQKRAPEEIQVGKKATFVIAVRNAGNATAHDVRVVDSVPQGARFVESLPPATPNAQGMLSWDLGAMSAGDERTITLQIVPEVQGEVGSSAVVYFGAQASVRTVATLPKLELELQSQTDMLISSRQQVSVIVKNTGTGVARGVRLEADLPNLLTHDSGDAQLAASLGDMRPNDVQPIKLDVTAVAAGQSHIVIRAVSDDGALAEQQVEIQVLAPKLIAQLEGPKLRYLERQATYRINVKNTGTAAASNLDFVVHLPTGLKYNSANNQGTYNPAQHTVSWGLHELPAGEPALMELTVLPVELGPQSIAFAATGDLGIKVEAKGTVSVEGLAELAYTIGQDNGTIETGASSTYSVQITNVGNKADKDVRLAVQLPSGAQLIKVDAQVEYRLEGSQIIFEPIPEMRNKDQFTYRFQVQHNQPGTQIVRTQVTSANWPVAVIKEEGTLVYNDQN